MEKQFKVLMLCVPASGHLNPLVCYGAELAKNPNFKVIMYHNRQSQKLIESANIEFREANFRDPSTFFSMNELRKEFPVHKMLNFLMETTDKLLPELVRCVQEEEIDLVVYDLMTVYAKWLMMRLRDLSQRGELNRPVPKAIEFSPSLLAEPGVYPNAFEEQFVPKPKLSLKLLFNLSLFAIKYVLFCFRQNFAINNPIQIIFGRKEPLTICCVVPEFQPRSHMFPSGVKFVGNCADEEFRGAKELDEPLKSFLAPFPERNPLPLVNLRVEESKLRVDCELIYISLGTVVNTEVEPFLKFIDGIKAINKSTPDDRYKFLMSVGDQSHAKLLDMNKNKQIELPANLLILPRVPQLDVLKRASLFITHSGQGSTSESIHYGVPMVCIPVMGDQPEVAYRTTDELGLGVQLNFDTFDGEAMKRAILKILGNRSYLERTVLFSQISRKYNGTKEATRITLEFLQTSLKKSS